MKSEESKSIWEEEFEEKWKTPRWVIEDNNRPLEPIDLEEEMKSINSEESKLWREKQRQWKLFEERKRKERDNPSIGKKV